MGDVAYMCKNRHGTYYARFIIPIQLRSHFNNKKEVRRSLQTDSRKLAVKRARAYRVQFESIVDQLMSKAGNTSKRTEQILDSLFADKTAIQKEATEKFVEGMRNGSTKPSNDDLSKTQYITVYHPETGKEIAKVDYNGDETKEIPAALAMVQAVLNTSASHSQAQIQTAPTGKAVSEYLDDYITAKMTPGKRGSWGAGTARQKPNKLNVFRSVFGDKPAAALTREDMEHYIKIAYAIPSNFRHPEYKKFDGITLDMVLNNAPEIESLDFEVRGAGTIRDDLKAIKAFLNWVSKYKDVGLQTPMNALGNEISEINYESDRRAFTDEELKTLLQDNNPAPENYVKCFEKPVKFWLPLIALYTGTRIAEICQLHLADIKLVKALSSNAEYWCIDINDDGGKKLKNKHSKRQIPIHQNLINAGLITYADNLKAKGETKLFPELANAHGNFGTQWFGIYSSQAGVTDKNTAFHSFRHNFCSYLAAHHIPEDLVIALSGHQYKSLAKSTYDRSRKRDVGKLAEVIDSIDYGLIHPEFE